MIAVVVIIQTASAFAQQPKVLDLEIKQGRFALDKNTVRVTEGDRLELRITSDRSGELHLHGYDVPIKLMAGKASVTVVDLKVAGRFPITSHGFEGDTAHKHRDHNTILYLEVYPR